uniref:Uncharacterized LOC111853491 n=1 Tax=Paramormyrops kingsleyae TaxID=1676925 RepID=A0A3B3QCJ5_9TELE|nr:uncharacterized protein LOC111853491 [Paramormyrops kingsleyae]
MASKLKQLVRKKEVIEDFMEIFEKGAEALSEAVGEMFPVFSIVSPLVQLAMDNQESPEAEFMKEQFQKVRDRLDVISEEAENITQEVKKSGVDAAYFQVEENLTSQFRKYMDILNAKPKFREVKKKLFMEHFAKTGGEKNLNTLYGAVTGDNFSGESVLEITLKYEEKNRRSMEDFCARLKNLFFIGLVALVGHAALKDCNEEEELLRVWAEKVKHIEEKMKAVVEDCKVNFVKQAEIDIGKRIRTWKGRPNQEIADVAIGFLKQKYDWVSWSVRIYAPSTGFFWKLIYGKKYHGISGGNHFVFDTEPHVVVSYSLQPRSLNKETLPAAIQGQKWRRNKAQLAEQVHASLPGCLVHVIRRHVVESSSFPDDAQYDQYHRKTHVFIYSD